MLMAQRKYQYDEPFDYQYEDHIQQPNMVKPRKATPAKRVSRTQKVSVKSLAVMLIMITLFGLIGAKTVHTNVVKGAEVRALEKELQALSVENDLLQVEADKLRSVARIEKVALAMGMERPEGTIYIASSLIQPTKTVGVEQTQKTAAVPAEGKPNSIFDSVFRIFTSFFASTQR